MEEQRARNPKLPSQQLFETFGDYGGIELGKLRQSGNRKLGPCKHDVSKGKKKKEVEVGMVVWGASF